MAALFGGAIILALYFLPTLIGAGRHVPNIGSVIVINVFLGWTVIGWIVALAMAARSVPPRLDYRATGQIWPPPPGRKELER